MSELERVADQVGEHLPDPARVPHHLPRRVRLVADDEIELLLGGAAGDHLRHLLDGDPEIERHRLDQQFAGFDLREIEDIVENGEERIRRSAHRFRELALLG